MKRTLRPSVVQDVYALQTRLREADVVELKAQDMDPSQSLVQGLWRSKPHCWTCLYDDLVVAMYGVVPGLCPQYGAIWLLGSEEMVRDTWFLRNCREELVKLSEGFTLLYNQVHDQNTVHIRWLQWMGFEFTHHRPPFIEFSKVIPHV